MIEVNEKTTNILHGEKVGAFLRTIAEAAKAGEIQSYAVILFDGDAFRVVSGGADDRSRKVMRTVALWVYDQIKGLVATWGKERCVPENE